jgi:hypothetical protein
MKYSFEETKVKSFEIENDRSTLLKKLNLNCEELDASDNALFTVFCKSNIRNICYYKGKIAKENLYRKLYFWATGLLVLAIPIFIYTFTDSKVSADLGTMLSAASYGIAAITSILGLHKLITSRIEKRKFRSIFHQAKVDLMNILFELEEEHVIVVEDEALSKYDRLVTQELRNDLKSGIKQSRIIVNRETKLFFDLSASPAFDLSAALTSSANTAKSLFSSLQSKRFESQMEWLKEEEKEKRAEEKLLKKEVAKSETSLSIAIMKIKRLIDKENRLTEQINSLEGVVGKEEELNSLIKQLESSEQELENLEMQYDELEIRLEHANDALA